MKEQMAARDSRALFVPNAKLRLLDQVREVARVRHFSLRTEETH